MTSLVKLTLVIALLLSIVIPFGYFLLGEKSKGRYKKTIGVNAFFFFSLMLVATIVSFSSPVSAANSAEAANGLSTGLAYLGAALSTGLSCVGGGIAVASAASAALGAISEDGSILGKSLIFVGLAEGVALYGLIISFMILGKIG
ncbi:MAG: ATP synthase subunit C [Lachnospiraceae bacterium]